MDQRRLICADCGNEITSDDDLFAPRHGAIWALCHVVVQDYPEEDQAVVWVPGFVCEGCGKRRFQALLH